MLEMNERHLGLVGIYRVSEIIAATWMKEVLTDLLSDTSCEIAADPH